MLWQPCSFKCLLFLTRKINLSIQKYKREAFHREAVLFNNIFKTFHISPFASIDRFDLVKNHLQMEDYDPGKICGLLIKNIQNKHYGNWT